MGEELAIELRGVKKTFDEVVAVHRFDVGIRKGEFFSLLGPSGCGKTTTLRMIAGLEEPTEGEILLEGREVSRVPAYRRNVHTVFQDYALFPHMDVRRNVWFPLKMRGVRLAEAAERIRQVLRLVNMEGFERRLPQQLSGGQRQRIALARSLVDSPAALLLDEPLGALDFKLRVAMQKVLKDIQRGVGITFIYVTHDQTEALTMSDRIAVMKGGHVHQIGTPDEIYNTPATAFVASFIGDMNFLRGRLTASSGGSGTVEVEGQTIVSSRCPPGLRPGEEVLACVRTERVQVNPIRATQHLLPGVVRRIVYRGTDYEATCSFGAQEIRAVVNSVSWDPAVRLGGEVRVGFGSQDVSVFPRSEESEIIHYSSEAV
jgi:spermidine/putrescine transport system ATP-binding protein